MITLGIETSTTTGSVALLADGAMLIDEVFSADRSHSSSLFVALQKIRSQVDRLDQVAIGLGPGSYAGVRIAIAAALGLEFSLGAQLVGLPSVAALQTDAPEFLVVGDARRDAFYFTHVRAGQCLEGPLLATADELAVRLASSAALPVFATAETPQAPGARMALPSAAILARLAAADLGITARHDLEPIYLREPYITLPKARPIFKARGQ